MPKARTRNPIEMIDNQADFEALCDELSRERLLGLDVETTIGEKPQRLCTIQFANRSKNWIIDALRLQSVEPVRKILEDKRIVKVIHYAPFEQGVMSQFGIKIENVFDTCSFSRNNRADQKGHSLAVVCMRELKMEMNKAYQKADWTLRPLSEAHVEYAALDAEILIRLYTIFTSDNDGCLLFS